ncbi:MAG: hypothetical protein JW751_19140 [Polyangiaceae bacterium]|nr:hypothetical protein [Polyangiaceae bacterium]
MTGVAACCGRTWTRLAAYLALAVFGGAQILAVFHFVFVRHVICWEHGALAHARHAVDHQDTADSPPPPNGESQASSGPTDHGDEHCGLPFGATHQLATDPDRAFVVAADSAILESAALPADTVARSIPLLALAPKQSPPPSPA